MINIKNLNPDFLKINKKSYKSIGISYIEYITMKIYDYVKFNSVNPLCIIINKVDGSTEEKNGVNSFASSDKNKKV